ncbi:MAG: YqiA/YcfP family alpha/beta fold hydrolase [Sporomusaceae bacterium]|nr:YqiA/YcfP family alpha/beta fold hydrolase [Sporomusaceae bacterium]
MKEIVIPTDTGELAGIWHEASAKTEKVFIISHGFNGSIDGTSRAELLAEAVAQLGFHVLRYKFTPCQKLSCQIEELGYAALYARQNLGSKLYLLGRSMGGSASLAFAHQDQAIEALCLWATPGDLPETFRLALGDDYNKLAAGENITVSDDTGSLTLTPDFIQDFANYPLFRYVQELGEVPVLVLHGDQDQVVPVQQAHKMYETALEPKKLVIIRSGDHQFKEVADQARVAVVQWLKGLE